MVQLYRKNKKQQIKPNPAADKTASVIATALLKMQTAWAEWLSAKEKKLSLKQKKIAFAIFCLCMTLIGTSFLYHGIFNKQNTSPAWLKTPSVTLPEDTRLPDSLNIDYLRELYKRRQAERHQTDSTHN